MSKIKIDYDIADTALRDMNDSAEILIDGRKNPLDDSESTLTCLGYLKDDVNNMNEEINLLKELLTRDKKSIKDYVSDMKKQDNAISGSAVAEG